MVLKFQRLTVGTVGARKTHAVLATGVILAFYAAGAHAAILLERVTLPVNIEHDSNPLMQYGNASSIWKLTFTPQYSVRRVDEQTQWNADFGLQIDRTSNQDLVINREDPRLGLGWRRTFERGEAGIRLGYDEASSRTSTLEETGTTGSDTTRTSKTLGVDGRYEMSEKLSLGMNGSYTRMTFRGQGSGAGSRNYAASASLNYQYSDYLVPYLQLSTNRSDPDDATATNLISAVAGARWILSPTLSAGGYVGKSRRSGGFSGQGKEYGANISYALERSAYTLMYSQSVSPAGNGGFIESEQLTGGWKYDISDYSRAGADFSLRKNTGSGDGETDRLSLWYGRDLTRDWNLKASYQYKITKGTTDQATGNVFGITVGYNFSEF